MKLGGYCPGCGGGAGNQSCPIAGCGIEHDKVEYCFLCPEYPCRKYEGAEEYDSFITHQRQLKDMERARRIGVEAYNRELLRKREILDLLLSEYNDGRRKTFFSVAVNLLSLEGLEAIINQLSEHMSKEKLTLKQKSVKAVELLNNLASDQAVEIKLRKKTSENK
jgi:hypothetical protein